MADVKHCTASPINNFEGFLHIFYCRIKNLQNHWLRNYFIKLVDRGECKIIWTRLTMFGRRIVEFLHKRTRQIFSLLTFGEWWFLSLHYCVFSNESIALKILRKYIMSPVNSTGDVNNLLDYSHNTIYQ
jgi:hypothetical protein